MRRDRQLLLLDADDTLWENNVYFERAIERFYALAGATTPAAALAMRACINREEHRVIADMGYGLASFEVALRCAIQTFAPERWSPAVESAIRALAAEIAAEPICFLPEVPETVRYLARRHRLALLTKGDFAEQSRKVAASGLGPLFERIAIVPEKDASVYRRQLLELAAPPETCWMIGNSPRSDINPALEAGLNAVFLPHPHTWVLEHDALRPRPGRELLQLERISQLCQYF
ncbi:MAG: HAD family hydrolase [Terriglobales bacterium]